MSVQPASAGERQYDEGEAGPAGELKAPLQHQPQGASSITLSFKQGPVAVDHGGDSPGKKRPTAFNALQLDPRRCQACTKRVAGVTETNDSLQCTKCDVMAHGKCMGLHADLVKRFVWHCLECRTCKECEEAADETAPYHQCELCDQSVHEKCLKPEMRSKFMETTGKFACEECIKCNFCKEELPLVETLAAGYWLENTERLCENCHNTYAKEGDECGLCRKSYDGDFVMCETCKSWHCIPCSNFTQE